MRILHLTLKKKWFYMIASGEKKEEYREQKKFWAARLMQWEYSERNNSTPLRRFIGFRHFDVVEFKNGYSKDAPTVRIELIGIESGHGNPEWGAEPGKEYFVIKLGKIISNEPTL